MTRAQLFDNQMVMGQMSDDLKAMRLKTMNRVGAELSMEWRLITLRAVILSQAVGE